MMKRLQNAKDTEEKTNEELATLTGALQGENIEYLDKSLSGKITTV